ncbi:MAG: carboxypeptidase regulatory-like domain-containing protein [Acidobacteria bacterium]|nr:carboxypeptidase regulatory-like domain-containing protein [Acidobacteriota bacterium]
MKKESFIKPTILWSMAFVVSLMLFSTTILNAQTTCTSASVTFAQFNQTTNRPDFVFTNSSPVSSFATTAGGAPVSFTFLGIAGLPAELSGPQSARAFFSCQTSVTAFVNVGRITQPFNGTCTIQIIRDVPATTPSGGSGTNLLTATIVNDPTTSDLSGDTNSNSAGFTASTPLQMITFSSDFLSFGATQTRNLALGFSSVNPLLSQNPNGFLNSFTASGAGTFASCPAPTFMPPTAAGATVGGRVLASNGRGLAKARVTLTNSSGETFTSITSSFGYYEFSDVSPGQTVILSVSSKRYQFTPRVLNVGEDLYDLDFIPE